MRTITSVYQDPLDLIWLETAKQMGIEVRRDDRVFAAWDGKTELRIGSVETLDPDDSLAQMIFHELCHALIEGPESLTVEDWGLDSSINQESQVREHACLRLQAAWADQYSLRNFLAATTDFRDYYDRLPEDPLRECNDPAWPIAIQGWKRAQTGPWSKPINSALELTAALVEVVHNIASATSLWSKS